MEKDDKNGGYLHPSGICLRKGKVKMKNKLVAYLVGAFIEGGIALYILEQMQFDPARGQTVNYALLRSIIAGSMLLILVIMLLVLFHILRNPVWTQRISSYLTEVLDGPEKRLFNIQGLLVVIQILLVEWFFLTYFALPAPLAPPLAWGILICFQTWLGLRLLFSSTYRAQPTLFSKLRSSWLRLLPVQRRTIITLSIIGLIYFSAFIPANAGENLHADEYTIYPEVVRKLTVGDSFNESVRNILGIKEWWYGYPYFPLSAFVLLIPRLIFGDGFADQIQLNMLLLRQFISVLPMILAIFVLVYVVTRFRSVLLSVSMFVFLLLIPGVIKNNYRFWHPEGIILLLIALTIYFLQHDKLRFRRNFYLAAITCGLAIAIKLWGFFFFLTIAGYLLAGFVQKALTFKRMILAGLIFIIVMGSTILISSPALLEVQSTQFMIAGLKDQINVNAHGVNEPDPEGVYRTGLENWMRYSEMYFLRSYFFYFLFFALIAGAMFGSEVYLNRIILSWTLVTAVYLIWFVSVKRFQYMLPMMLPLHCGAFLFPAIAGGRTRWQVFLRKPVIYKSLRAITFLLIGSQFVFNLVDIVTSPVILPH